MKEVAKRTKVIGYGLGIILILLYFGYERYSTFSLYEKNIRRIRMSISKIGEDIPGIEVLRTIPGIDDEKIKTALVLIRKAIEKNQRLDNLVSNTISALANLNLERFEEAIKLGVELLDKGIGPCYCLTFLVPIIDKSSSTISEYQRNIEKLKNLMFDLVNNSPYPGYTIKYVFPIIGNLAKNIDQIQIVLDKVRELFLKLKEWKTEEKEKLKSIYQLQPQEYEAIEEEIEEEFEGIKGERTPPRINVKEVNLENLFEEIRDSDLLKGIASSLGLSNDISSFLNCIDLELRLFEKRIFTKTKKIRLSIEAVVTWLTDGICPALKLNRDPDYVQYERGEECYFHHFIERKIENLKYYRPLALDIVKVVGKDSHAFSTWVNRLYNIKDKSTLLVCINNLETLIEHFKTKTEREWDVFVDFLVDYLKSHSNDLDSIRDIISEALKSC